MLEVFHERNIHHDYIEHDPKGVTLVLDKIQPKKTIEFYETYHAEECYVKIENNKIKLAQITDQQREWYKDIPDDSCDCKQEPCPGLLKLLCLLFKTEFYFYRDPKFSFILSSPELNPYILFKLSEQIKSAPFYFTTKHLHVSSESTN